MKNKFYLLGSFIILIIVTILSLVTNLKILGLLRVFGSIFFLLFFPGYVIVKLILDKEEYIEKVVLGVILSIGIIPLIIFNLNKLNVKITLFSGVLSIILVILLTFVARCTRRWFNQHKLL